MKNDLALLGGTPILKKPLPPYQSLGPQETRAVMKAMNGPSLSGFIGRAGDGFLGGPYVKKLEKQFCDYFGVKHAVSFNSATCALHSALVALGIGPGDEVITTPTTMSATSSAILMQNALPVFADIQETSFCLDTRSIQARITKNTRAIIVVNLFGGSADYDPIIKIAKKYKLFLIEDNAQAIMGTYRGRLTGTIGDIGVFSFNQNKVIHCGEGGVLITNHDKFGLRAQLHRNHGEAVVDDLYAQGVYEALVGTNYRLTELQAAIASEQLRKVHRLIKKRIMLAQYLTKQLRKFHWLIPPSVFPKSKHVYYVYPFRFLSEHISISRATFVKAIKAEGFALGEGYLKPTYLLPLYQKQEIFPRSSFPFVSKEYPHQVSYKKGLCPVAERMHEKELLLTTMCQPPQTKREIDMFIKAIRKIEQQVEHLKDYEAKQKP